MKIHITSVFLVITTLHSFAQITFEKGYFINNNNQRIECLIKNTDWKNNPTEFEYKLTAGGTSEKGSLNTVKEFGVTDFSRYVMADTKIDVSPSDLNHLSKKPDPEWSQQKLFLKVLVDGKATLYYYENKGLTRFFYSVSDTAINQLIYKEYYTADNQVAENRQFHGQLWTDVRLTNANMNSIQNIRYYISDLVRYFKKYNESEGNSSIVNYETNKKDSFHLRVTPGINYSRMSISSDLFTNYEVDFGSQASFRAGIEAEYILPFNKNKWAILVEPTFQYFHATNQTEILEATIQYNSIEFPVGLRYYFFLNPELKLFLDAYAIQAFDIIINSSIQYHYNFASPWDISTSGNFAFGVGIGYKRYSAEVRYYTNRKFLEDKVTMITKYQRISAIFGFKLF